MQPASSQKNRPPPVSEAMPDGAEPVSWMAAQAQKHGPVFRIPAMRPTYVVSGHDALRLMDDPDLVERTIEVAPQDVPLFKLMTDPGVPSLSFTKGAEHQRRRSAWLAPGGLDHAGIAKTLPVISTAVGSALAAWEKQTFFSLNQEVRRVIWQVMSQLLLGQDADEQRLADFEIWFAPATLRDPDQHKQHLLDWLSQQALRHEGDTAANDSCIAAWVAASGKLSHAEMVNEIKHGFTGGLLSWIPMAEILRQLALDPQLCATLQAEVSGQTGNAVSQGSAGLPGKNSRLMGLVKDVLRQLSPLTSVTARAKTSFSMNGMHIPAGAVLIAAYHASSQLLPPDEARGTHGLAFGQGVHLCPGRDLTSVILYLFTARVLANYQLVLLDPADLPQQHATGYFCAGGCFVQFSRLASSAAKALPMPASVGPSTSTAPSDPAANRAQLARTTRIAIIGAGITGLTCAHELRKSGFVNVTVFEQAASVGGKADTVEIDGRPYNLGAHLCDRQFGVAGLAQEVGVGMERSSSYVLWDMDQNQALERSYNANAAVRKLRQLYASNRQTVHASGFANSEAWTYAPVSNWLDAHDLGALREIGPFFTGAGYGFLDDDVPAAFFLKFALDMNEEGWTPSGGYKHLLQRLATGLDVRCSTRVVKIARETGDACPASRGAAVIHITSRNNQGSASDDADYLNATDALCHEQFERLILTGPLEHSQSYLDWSAQEQALFSRIQSHDYYTVLATLDIAQPHAPGLYIVPKHTASSSLKGHTTAFARIFAESTVYHFYCYGEPGQTEASILENLRADAKKLGGELRQVHVCQKWAYAPQVSPHDMALGFHQRLENLQGQRGTYYAGSLLAFELTDHNVMYAQNLMQRCFANEFSSEVSSESASSISTPVNRVAASGPDPDARLPQHGTNSLLDILRERYAHTPDAIFSTFLDTKGKPLRALSYQMLVERAMACAASLRAKGCKPGDRVALVYPPDTDEFLIGFFGCLCAEVIAVPVACPDPRKLDVEIPRFAHLMQDCDCRFALTTRLYHGIALAGRTWNRLTNLGSDKKIQWPQLTWISTDGLSPLAPGAHMPIPAPAADTLAYIQYTSGSTSAPKGVMITHGNVLHNVDAIRLQTGVSASSVLAGWVPLFHDMGLVGGPLTALYCGAHMVFFSPTSFLQNPLLWLKAIHQYRATHTESPNFGYEFLLRHLDDKALQGLDLSCLSHVLFGGEAMRHRTFERVAVRLHGTGFRAQAMTNIFGAAEATLFLAGGGLQSLPLLSVNTHLLESRRRAVVQSPDSLSTTTLIGCGLPPANSDVRIVDANTRRLLPDGAVGEIWLASPSVSCGYWGRPDEQNAAIFRARIADDPAPLHTYLRTGDLGFVERNILYICGRLKEMMIFSGRNIHPMDIELCAMNAHAAIRQGCVAAFSVEEQEQEKLVIVAELKTNADSKAAAAAAAITQALAGQHSLACKAVVLVRSGSLPKTSSGKLQRYRAREDYLAKQLQVIHVQLADQVAHTDLLAHDTAVQPDPLDNALFDERFSDDVRATRHWLQRLLALFLHVSPGQIDCATPLAMLGVDSAQVLMITSRISKYLGREFAPSVLYEHPSIDALALFLCTHTGQQDQGLVQLQHGEPGQFPTLFCTHPVGGSPMAYLGLVEALPNTIPVYAFGNENSAMPAQHLIAMAQYYVAEMRAVQASGPYWLVGYSFGGSVAYEMARQVLAAGEQIACIFMIDAPAPVYIENAAGPNVADIDTYGGLMETAILNHLIPDQLDDQEREKMLARIDSNQRAMAAYRIVPNGAAEPPIMMFRASEEAAHLRDASRHPAFDRPDFGWHEVAPGAVAEIMPMPGDHFSIMNEPTLLAQQLLKCLLEIQASGVKRS